jgi:hypothetical protein
MHVNNISYQQSEREMHGNNISYQQSEREMHGNNISNCIQKILDDINGSNNTLPVKDFENNT